MRRAALASLALVAAASCDEFQPIELGRCGNRVIEPEVDERCEPEVQAGCGPVGSAQACQWTCGLENGGECPPGYGCSVLAGVCNEVSTDFDPIPAGSVPQVIGVVELADATGDGFTDVLHWDGDAWTLSMIASLPSGEPSLPPTFFTLGAVRMPLGVTDPVFVGGRPDPTKVWSAPQPPDLMMLATFLGQSLVPFRSTGSTLAPLPQSVERVPSREYPRGMAADTLRPTTAPFACPLRVGATGESLVLHYDAALCPGGPPETVEVQATIPFTGGVEDLALLTADLVGDGAEEAVVWVRSTGTLLVAEVATDPWEVRVSFQTSAPATEAPCGFVTARVDADPEPDLVLCADGVVYVASAAAGFADAAPWAAFSAVAPGGILAAGDLDADGDDDFVTPGGVYLLPDFDLRAPRLFSSWRGATLGDFNRDGVADVAATTGSRFVDLLLASPDGWFNESIVAAAGQVTLLETGDYDGDRTDDVAFAHIVTGDPEMPVETTISVLFGDASGHPSQVASMGGPLWPVASLSAVHVAPEPSVEDLVSELMVLEARPSFDPAPGGVGLDHSFLFFVGSPTRVMLAPHFFDPRLGIGQERWLGRRVVGRFVPALGGGAPPQCVIAEVTSVGPAPGLQLLPAVADETLRFAEPTADAVEELLVFEPEGGLPFDPGEVRMIRADLDGDSQDSLLVVGPGFVTDLRLVPAVPPAAWTLAAQTVQVPELDQPVAAAAVRMVPEDPSEDLFVVTPTRVLQFVAGGLGTPTVLDVPAGRIAAAHFYLPAAGTAPHMATLTETDAGVTLLVYRLLPTFQAPSVDSPMLDIGPDESPFLSIASGDLNGDGLTDLAVSGPTSMPRFYLARRLYRGGLDE